MNGLEQTLTQVQQEHRCHREESWSQGQFVMGQIQTMRQMSDIDIKKRHEEEWTLRGSPEATRREVGVDIGTVVVDGNERGSRESPNPIGGVVHEQDEEKGGIEQVVKEGISEKKGIVERRESLREKEIWVNRPWRQKQYSTHQEEENQKWRTTQGKQWRYWRNQTWERNIYIIGIEIKGDIFMTGRLIKR